MKLCVVLAFVAVAAAAPQGQRNSRQAQDVQLLKYDSDTNGLGQYRFVFEQSDGQKRKEEGELKTYGEEQAVAVKGSYEWVGPDDVTYVVNYIADEEGFQPTIEQGPGGGVPPGVVASLLG